MSKMHSLPETSAVHLGIQDPQQKRKQGKPGHDYCGSPGGCLSGNSGHQAHAEEGLQKGEAFRHHPRCRTEKTNMKKRKILPDNQH